MATVLKRLAGHRRHLAIGPSSGWLPAALTRTRTPAPVVDTPATRAEQRVAELLAGQLSPFGEAAETAGETAVRLSGYAVQAAKQAVELAPIGAVGRTAYRTINTVRMCIWCAQWTVCVAADGFHSELRIARAGSSLLAAGHHAGLYRTTVQCN